jgi:heme/copper-type cytochrome/quinol oxidase subunit 4
MNCRFEFTFTVLAISTVLSGFFTITVTVTIVLDFAVPTIIHQHTWDALEGTIV